MADEIVNQFLQYLESIKGQFDLLDADLKPLIDQTKFCTPIQLKYSNPEAAIRNMSSVIIQNICKYTDSAKYPKYGLDAIKSVITKNLDDQDSQAQLMLLVHITKMKLSIYESAMYCKCFARMRIKTEYTDQLNAWKDVAYKVLAHSEVNKTINDLMERTFSTEYSERIQESDSIKVSIKFVDTTENDLRGFAGINCVYINEFYLHIKASQLHHTAALSAEEIENILLMDVVTVTLHEYSQVRIRQVLDDLNMSSPNFIAETAITEDAADPEFGRIVERKFFDVTINWMKSIECGAVPVTYITNFLNAVNTNSALPVLTYNVHIVKRSRPQTMHGGGSGGADLSYALDHMLE